MTDWVVADCWDCGGWGCKPPEESCPTCHGEGLLKYRADYTAADLSAPTGSEELFRNSREKF